LKRKLRKECLNSLTGHTVNKNCRKVILLRFMIYFLSYFVKLRNVVSTLIAMYRYCEYCKLTVYQDIYTVLYIVLYAGFVGQKRRKKISFKLHLLLYKRFHLLQHSRLTNPTLYSIVFSMKIFYEILGERTFTVLNILHLLATCERYILMIILIFFDV
jgi:hypothetical protein